MRWKTIEQHVIGNSTFLNKGRTQTLSLTWRKQNFEVSLSTEAFIINKLRVKKLHCSSGTFVCGLTIWSDNEAKANGILIYGNSKTFQKPVKRQLTPYIQVILPVVVVLKLKLSWKSKTRKNRSETWTYNIWQLHSCWHVRHSLVRFTLQNIHSDRKTVAHLHLLAHALKIISKLLFFQFWHLHNLKDEMECVLRYPKDSNQSIREGHL